MPSTDEVAELLTPHLMGDLNEIGASINVLALNVTEGERSFTATFEVLAENQRWRVSIPSGDKWEMAIFDGAPDSDLVLGVANALRTRLAEWWHTKDAERTSGQLGTRLD